MHISIEFYIPPKIPKIKNEKGDATMDFGDVKVEHAKNILSLGFLNSLHKSGLLWI